MGKLGLSYLAIEILNKSLRKNGLSYMTFSGKRLEDLLVKVAYLLQQADSLESSNIGDSQLS